MKLDHENYEQLSVMNLRGDLTSDNTEELRALATELMDQKQVRDFVLNLEGVEFVDSKGLETLLWLQEQSGERLGQVRLAGVTANVEKILQYTRLAPRFDRQPGVDQAIKSLRM